MAHLKNGVIDYLGDTKEAMEIETNNRKNILPTLKLGKPS